MQLHPSFTQLMTHLSSVIKWTDKEMKALAGQLKVQCYKKNTYFLQPPQICEHIYFINSGFCKACLKEENEKERIIHFAGKNEFITDMLGFLSPEPVQSNLYCMAIQEAEVVLVPRTAIDWIINDIPQGNKLLRVLYSRYAQTKMLDLHDSFTPDPMERLKNLIVKFPDIEQQVSQKIIASYLNITPEYFSMLKAKHKRF